MTGAGDRYDSTRRAWQDIWDGASMRQELAAVQSARSMATIRAYLPHLPKGEPLLEAGSGLSAVVITLRERGYDVQGLDYAVNALQESRRYDPTLPLAAGDVHALPWRDGSFGAYLSFGVLEHFEHGMSPALAEAYRVLRPGGVLALTIPYPNLVYRLVQWRRRMRGSGQLTDDEFYESVWTCRELVDVVKGEGFAVVTAQATSHSFTLWGLGGPFRADDYYGTTRLAEALGAVLRRVMPWAFNFSTLLIAQKPD